MNTIRERILVGMKNYANFSNHKDLIAFCVSSDCFEDWDEVEENGGNHCADFSELIVIVEKDWLFTQMKNEGIEEPLAFLQNEYTSDDSYEWFFKAKAAAMIVCVTFN